MDPCHPSLHLSLFLTFQISVYNWLILFLDIVFILNQLSIVYGCDKKEKFVRGNELESFSNLNLLHFGKGNDDNHDRMKKGGEVE